MWTDGSANSHTNFAADSGLEAEHCCIKVGGGITSAHSLNCSWLCLGLKHGPYQIIVADAADAVSVNFSGRCKFFFRFNAKNWQFTVYFAVITQKIVNLLCILS